MTRGTFPLSPVPFTCQMELEAKKKSRKELSWLFPGMRLTMTTHTPPTAQTRWERIWSPAGDTVGCHPCMGTRFLWDAPDTDAVLHLPVLACSVLASTA